MAIVNTDTIEVIIVNDKKLTDRFVWCKKPKIYSFFNNLIWWESTTKKTDEWFFKVPFNCYISKEDFIKGVDYLDGWKNTSEFILDEENNVYWKPEVIIRFCSGKITERTFNSLQEAEEFAKRFSDNIINKTYL